jgi:hypothetical protein
MQQQKDERSIGELFSDLARDTGTLVRQEMALARTEITHTMTRAGRDIGVLVVGGAVVYAGFLALVAAAIIGIAAAGLDWWLAALIVGIIIAGIGAVLVQRGLGALRQEHLVPRQTIETLKEDVAWAKEQV